MLLCFLFCSEMVELVYIDSWDPGIMIHSAGACNIAVLQPCNQTANASARKAG